ncbi:MAG: FHA domain-containing protein [Gemmataceae bacterium]
MKVRLQVQTAAARNEVEYAGPVITIGRNPDATLSLDGVGVSWEHARIDLAAKKAAVSDLKSTNGTFLNGQPVLGSAPLKVGDTIRLGQEGPRMLVLTLELSASPTVPQATPAAATRAETFAAPGLLDIPTRGDDEIPIAAPPKRGKNGQPAAPPVSATRKLLLKTIQQHQSVQTKHKRSLWGVATALLALMALLAVGLWLAHTRLGVFGTKLDEMDSAIAKIGTKLDSQRSEIEKQFKDHVELTNRTTVELATKLSKQEEDKLKNEGKLTELTKSVLNLNELNVRKAVQPAAEPPLPPPPADSKAKGAARGGLKPGQPDQPPGNADNGPPEALPPAPPAPADAQAAAVAAAEASQIEFKPGDHIDLLAKNGNVYTGSLVFLSAETVKILSNPNWPEKPSSHDMRDVLAIQTKDGIYAYNRQSGTFVNALTSYRFNKETGNFDRMSHGPGDLYLSENVKIVGTKTVNGLYSLGSQGEIAITLPLPNGPERIPAYQFSSMITAKGVFLFIPEKNVYEFKSHTQIAAEAKETNDKNWRAFTDERYRKNMEGYEAATRRLAALSTYWGTRWWWW